MFEDFERAHQVEPALTDGRRPAVQKSAHIERVALEPFACSGERLQIDIDTRVVVRSCEETPISRTVRASTSVSRRRIAANRSHACAESGGVNGRPRRIIQTFSCGRHRGQRREGFGTMGAATPERPLDVAVAGCRKCDRKSKGGDRMAVQGP